MEGMNKHLEFQIKLAQLGAAPGMGSGGGSPSGNGNQGRMPSFEGTVPDDIPDIGSMVAIDRSN